MDKESGNQGPPDSSSKVASDDHQDNVDEELAKLLDSSLQEFGKAATTPESKPSNEVNLESLGASHSFDKEEAQRAAAEFQKMLTQISEMQKVMLQQMTSEDGIGVAAMGGDSSLSSEQSASAAAGGEEADFAQAFMRNLNFLAENAQKIQQSGNPADLEDAVRQLHSDNDYENEFLPFMQGLMSSLLSKETLYPSLKEMSEKYPAWLEENRQKTDSASLERYEAQLRLIQEACKEFEEEKDDDPDDVKAQRFDKLISTMQKMQACGHPPEDLVGALPPGWAVDDHTGIPHIVDQDKATESCSIM